MDSCFVLVKDNCTLILIALTIDVLKVIFAYGAFFSNKNWSETPLVFALWPWAFLSMPAANTMSLWRCVWGSLLWRKRNWSAVRMNASRLCSTFSVWTYFFFRRRNTNSIARIEWSPQRISTTDSDRNGFKLTQWIQRTTSHRYTSVILNSIPNPIIYRDRYKFPHTKKHRKIAV